MKKIIPVLTAVILSFVLCITTFGASGSWMKDNKGWWYKNADGSYPADGWQFIDKDWYYFNSEGYMQTGWLYVDDDMYYLSPSGAMCTGWQQIDGDWYFFDTYGAMFTGWLSDGGNIYYLDETGVMLNGSQDIDGVTMQFLDNGMLLLSSLTNYFEFHPLDYYSINNIFHYSETGPTYDSFIPDFAIIR